MRKIKSSKTNTGSGSTDLYDFSEYDFEIEDFPEWDFSELDFEIEDFPLFDFSELDFSRSDFELPEYDFSEYYFNLPELDLSELDKLCAEYDNLFFDEYGI